MDEIKTCAICLGSVEAGRGQAIFTAECSHSFHFSCITDNVKHGNRSCPICRANWSDLPLIMRYDNSIRVLNPYPNIPAASLQLRQPVPEPLERPIPDPQPRPQQSPSTILQLLESRGPEHPNLLLPHRQTRQLGVADSFLQLPTPRPRVPTTPIDRMIHQLQFSEHGPLPTNPNSTSSPSASQNVTIKAIPERRALAASESISDFAVLVNLTAPTLPGDACQSQKAPVDLVMVLDVSASMHGAKLALVKQAVNFVIDNLGPSDRLSVVSFCHRAQRIFPLRRMTENGRVDAKQAVDSLVAGGGTNIVEGLGRGVQVLQERRYGSPVASMMFLSDGVDTCHNSISTTGQPPDYLHLLPPAIRPGNRESEERPAQSFSVQAFGFGADHDPLAMHAISDASGGTFSFVESYDMVQDAFASCIGGLLSVVALELQISVKSATDGVEIKSIASGRYKCEIFDRGSVGRISIGDLYADEEKEFLINLYVPIVMYDAEESETDENETEGSETEEDELLFDLDTTMHTNDDDDEERERMTSLLDIACSYRDVSGRKVTIETDIVEIQRPDSVSPEDMAVHFEVDRQRNRLNAAESIAEAQQMAETGDLTTARDILSNRRSSILASRSEQAGDDLSLLLEAEMKETEQRMGSLEIYGQAGRAYALSVMSSHGYQRATTRSSSSLEGAAAVSHSYGGSGPSASARPSFGSYVTPRMASMVNKSQQLSKTGDIPPK